MITVYTKENCVQCTMVKKSLDKNNIPYETVDVMEDKEAFDMIVSLGFSSVPVVISGDISFAGFQPDKISQLSA